VFPAPIPTDPEAALAALRDATVAFSDAEQGDPEETLQLALEHLIAVTSADAGAIAVPGPEGRPVLLAERFLDQVGPLSMSVLARTLRERGHEATVNEPPSSASVAMAGITSILCTPVVRQGRTLAAVYLDRRQKPPFDGIARHLAVSFAALLAVTVDLTRKAEHIEGQAAEARALAAHVHDYWRFGAIVTTHHGFAACLQVAERAAQSDATLLVLGETGVGKEHLARCVHEESARRAGPFIPVNCAALPETLLESELFGHEKGAFTGAAQMRKGRFEMADGGTLFLDEIGEMPPSMQAKLLRVLEDRTILRVGGSAARAVDVRIVAATHRELEREVAAGRFREDLYYRLNVVTLRIPALRERIGDLPELARVLLERDCGRTGRKLVLTEAAVRRLGEHPWPGNVRELRNAIEKLCVLAVGPELDAADVETHVLGAGSAAAAVARESRPGRRTRRLGRAEAEILRLRGALRRLGRTMREALVRLEKLEAAGQSEAGPDSGAEAGSYKQQLDAAARRIITQALAETGTISAAAKRLDISRQNLSLACKRLGVPRS
jgi:transcriptional regulator with GAF, ATPase, and Fis domain